MTFRKQYYLVKNKSSTKRLFTNFTDSLDYQNAGQRLTGNSVTQKADSRIYWVWINYEQSKVFLRLGRNVIKLKTLN